MDHLLHVLDRIEELLRELILAEVGGAMIELKGFDVICSLVHVCWELVSMLQEGVGLPPFPKTIREKGVHLELEEGSSGERRSNFRHCLFPSHRRRNSEHTRESSRPP